MENACTISVVKKISNSIEEFADSFKIFDARIIQLSKGNFQGFSTTLDLGDVIFSQGTSVTKYQIAGSFSDNLTFCFPLDGRPFYTSRGLLEKRSQPVSVGNCDFKVIYPENFDHIVVSIKRGELSKYLSEEEVELFEQAIIKASNKQFSQRYSALATEYISKMFSSIQVKHEKHELDGVSNEEYCRMIIFYLYDYLGYYQNDGVSVNSNYARILSRGFEAIDKNGTNTLGLNQLAEQTYSSKRSIQYAFSKIIEMSPMQFIRTNKLNKIRKDLLVANSSNCRVSDILKKYRISNQGRFNKEYSDFFQEHPKQTLLQAEAKLAEGKLKGPVIR